MFSFNQSSTAPLYKPTRQPRGPPANPGAVNFLRGIQSPSSSSACLCIGGWGGDTTGAGSRVHTSSGSIAGSLAALTITDTSTFRPNAMVLQERSGISRRGIQLEHLIPSHSEYLGDTRSKSYKAQVNHLADHLNCALYLTDIPLTITFDKVFDAIDCGTVVAIDIKEPAGIYTLKAADVIFTRPESAAAFLAKIEKGIIIDGQRLSARYNKFGQPLNTTDQTRVLFIDGPDEMMQWNRWFAYFDRYCVWQASKFNNIYRKNGRAMFEIEFVRIVGQAQTIKQAIEKDPELRESVVVGFCPDPCDARN
ncbi:hypothetical protein HYALB_00013547 [Hymenoscyphus albidus]|uniref:Uncharacterized protein n=1 Tax=Hymenoscyphus albidus TaxID=595503 RepID=A0A9N9LTE9_9HELO|nr:hypothetical protein HYALB_00013547 [Hymenoscyphus albidus]